MTHPETKRLMRNIRARLDRYTELKVNHCLHSEPAEKMAKEQRERMMTWLEGQIEALVHQKNFAGAAGGKSEIVRTIPAADDGEASP